MIQLKQIKKGSVVFANSGKSYTVLEVTKDSKYPILAKSQTNGTVGRFLLSSVSLTAPSGATLPAVKADSKRKKRVTAS
jgi:hypothetical protein